ncbi:cyclin-E binding protein 1, putative [Trichomonas vaginalis G3]|uniref:HECT-type E3 ubiquitin transferase n=1 Tax=Trichomonas vaginalis (strain ATCC PRA-98 / G3) TaxID=412133 RepID=A2F1J8_TRIV3|nr:Hect, E3 ligase catalytic domain family [Trichomonas vaginalis G3]EAY01216.1 cyclin-E binding protein 1, putative [Trichomonas vaginalis G3]KAI5532504.1 Hect, E3 ligase catalytic domain family [Trichomonas vaginalis G3]|eukprot:XP_001330132.1 cyclin-E binding protein 1 [Trichomonas vaginalis G3]
MKLYPSIIKLLSCGDDDIPSKVFKKHLVYKKIDLPLINMLVDAFSELSPDEKHQLLIFITGSATISPYSTDKITVEKAWSDSGGWNGYLPRASTCFKTLYLPEYDSTEIMIDKLRKAMYECLITDNYRYFDDSIFENDE